MKKPPDIYKCIKMPLQSIIVNVEHLAVLNDAADRANRIVVKAYQLLRLWLLTKYEANTLAEIEVTKDVICTCFKVVTKNSKLCKSDLFKEMSNLFTFEREDGKQLTQILYQYSAIEMLTAFENNIKMHFFDYLRRFVNYYWLTQFKTQLENKEIKRKDILKELKRVKTDLINGTKTCDEKYWGWVKEVKKNLLPETSNVETNYFYDVQKNPQKYLKHMIWMNVELEKIDGKMFQFCPLRTNIIPCCVQIDNATIVKLLVETKNKKTFLGKLSDSEIRRSLWNGVFHTTAIDKIRLKNYHFDYAFQTNGFHVSLRFIHIDELVKQTGIKSRIQKGKKEAKGLTKEERQKRQNEKKVLPKSTQIKKSAKKQKDVYEFPYIDEVDIGFLKSKKYVVIDPGKRDLMTMMDSEGKKLKYSNKQRVRDSKRLKYQRLTHNYREKTGILEIEKELLGLNAKTCNVTRFKEYLKVKNDVNAKLFGLYRDEKFRKLKWYAFIQTKKCEANMLNQIEKTYGKDIHLIHGDWSQGKQMRNFISTPNLGIKRKLKERFSVLNIDEYKSSKLNCVSRTACSNLYLKDSKGNSRKMHSILTYQMENTRLACINRDSNACFNLRYIFEHFLETGERLSAFSRIKDCNPLSSDRASNAVMPFGVQRIVL